MDLKQLWDIFWMFTKVALFSWGGGPGSMGLMQRETVAAGWVTPEDFADGLALSNALPGPLAPQVSAYIGYKMAGGWGAMAAVIGSVVPATIIMLILVVYFFNFKDLPQVKAMITGVRPFVVGLLAWTTLEMARTIFDVGKLGWVGGLTQNWDKALIALGSFLVLNFTTISPIWVVIAMALLGLVVYRKHGGV